MDAPRQGEARPWWDAPLRAVVGGRKVIVVAPMAVGAASHARRLLEVGASEVMAYGLGPGPAVEDMPFYEVPEAPGLSEMLAHWDRHTHDPTPEAVAAMDAFDPEGEAIVIRACMTEPTHVAGRPVANYRPPEWVALEDKTVVDAFWDRHDIAHRPSIVVDTADAAGAWNALDEGNGTVWAGDCREGINTGGALTRRVRTRADADHVTADLAEHCDRVRVMPYVDGLPCSIHGIVCADGVVALRPCEMIVLASGTRFAFAGVNTYWDPPQAARDEMRAMVRRVGEALAKEVDFRGPFTVDGVLDEDGFWPTELNPRVGGGLAMMLDSPDGPPILACDLIARDGRVSLPAEGLEQSLLEGVEAQRVVSFFLDAPHERREVTRPAVLSDGCFHWGEPGEPGFELVATGSLVMAKTSHEVLPVGPSAGRVAQAFARFVDSEFGTDLADLMPARDPFA